MMPDEAALDAAAGDLTEEEQADCHLAWASVPPLVHSAREHRSARILQSHLHRLLRTKGYGSRSNASRARTKFNRGSQCFLGVCRVVFLMSLFVARAVCRRPFVERCQRHTMESTSHASTF